MSFGTLVTKVTSKFGIISRKAAVRLSTETGKALVDRSRELGRTLNSQEINTVFSQTLPKKLRPQFLGSRDELTPLLENLGYSSSDAIKIAHNPRLGGGVFPIGSKKAPIMIPLKEHSQETLCGTIAHELEHALEKNNLLKGKIGRKLTTPYMILKKLSDKNFMQKVAKIQSDTHNMQIDIKNSNKILSIKTIKLTKNMEKIIKTDNLFYEGAATRKGLNERNGVSEKRYFAKLRDDIRNFVNGKRKQSQNNGRTKLYNAIFDMEIPAYSVGGAVDRYALNLGKNQTSTQEATALVYKDAQKVLKQECRLYWKNKLFGRLGKPSVYQSDKDLYRLVSKKEDKAILKELTKPMAIEEKEALFNLIRKNPQKVQDFKKIIEMTTIDGKTLYRGNFLADVRNVNPEAFKNPDFLKIANVAYDGKYPVYAENLEEISKLSPESIKRFSEIAGIKGSDGNFKYTELLFSIDKPSFDSLKKLADIEIDGHNVYAGLVRDAGKYLNPQQIEKVLQKAKKAQQEGKHIGEMIYRYTQLNARKPATFVKGPSLSLRKNIFAKKEV